MKGLILIFMSIGSYGGSYLPGDIVTTFSGKTVEILNTDAEGRVVLCDGIEQAKRLKCKTVIDLATLTGACVVALGKHKAGLFSNDQKLSEKIEAAAKDSCEPVWRLPYEQEYIDEMKAKIDSEQGKKIYARRLGIVEPVFANICVQKHMNRFTLRSKLKVDVQWRLFALVHNIGKIHVFGALT